MKILLVNNEGAGFADYKEIADGLSVSQLFRQEMGDRSPEDFLIRVNREQVSGDYELEEGDRVTITPTNIEGA
ncbi:MAG: MoaD/ThiS family protein [Promethearchaeota archaeon]|jgi:molybdopterin converting factor small subunit